MIGATGYQVKKIYQSRKKKFDKMAIEQDIPELLENKEIWDTVTQTTIYYLYREKNN